MNNAFSSCALLVVCCILNVSLYATCWPFMYACGLFCAFITVERRFIIMALVGHTYIRASKMGTQ